MPLRGCSPVGSTHVNLFPKSLNTELCGIRVEKFQNNSDAPEQSMYFGRYKGDAVLVRPIVDFKLFGEWNSTQDDDLTGLRIGQTI